MGDLSDDLAQLAFAALDMWLDQVQSIPIETSDIEAAIEFVRQPRLGLRLPDALHVIVAKRLGATLATLDVKLATAARALGAPVAP